MKLRLLFFFLFFLILDVANLCAKDLDNEFIVFRSFDQEKIDDYKENCDYLVDIAPSGIWERFTEWLSAKLKSIFKNVPEKRISAVLEIVIKTILWGLGIFAVIMVFITFFKNGIYKAVQKADKKMTIEHQNLEEQILETNWQNLIDIEIKAERFNVALRLLFLQTIQILNEKQLIKWKKNKTNFDYLRELRKTRFESPFTNLMHYYNFGWFGEFKINELEFREIQSEFNIFKTSVN